VRILKAGSLVPIDERTLPFTDYDFYAYLASGAVLLAAIDYAFGLGNLGRTDWSFAQIIVGVAVAYVTGQLTATLSAVIFENWLARTLLHRPFAVLVGIYPERSLERIVSYWIAAPYYRPLAAEIQCMIVERAKRDLKADKIKSSEQVFQPAYADARKAVHLNLHGVGVLFPGDLERDGWLALLRRPDFRTALANTHVLIASHHGRDNGCCDEIFQFCKPYYVVISDKGYQYDTQQTIPFYRSHARGGPFRGETRRVLTTHNDGRIGFSFTPGAWEPY
jgi:hypothetical protein